MAKSGKPKLRGTLATQAQAVATPAPTQPAQAVATPAPAPKATAIAPTTQVVVAPSPKAHAKAQVRHLAKPKRQRKPWSEATKRKARRTRKRNKRRARVRKVLATLRLVKR